MKFFYSISFLFIFFKVFDSYDYYEKIRAYHISNNLINLERSSGYVWWHWGSWSERCERKCSERFGHQTRHRVCLYCEKGVCIETDNYHNKNRNLNLKNGCELVDKRDSEKRICYAPSYCDGHGVFTGYYGEWAKFKNCSDVIENYQVFKRKCLASTKSKKMPRIEFQCTDLTYLYDEKYEKCNFTRNVCEFGAWSKWKNCDFKISSITNLDSVFNYRERECRKLTPKCYCEKYDLKQLGTYRDCLTQWSEWSSWPSCDMTCEKYVMRTRSCPGESLNLKCACDKFYLECSEEFKECNHNRAGSYCSVVDGKWGPWSHWTECTVTCGFGQSKRSRSCNNPAPANNGTPCIGSKEEFRFCDSNVFCEVNGQWSDWFEWECSSTCGMGVQTRVRMCDNPPAMFGGQQCVGKPIEQSECIAAAEDDYEDFCYKEETVDSLNHLPTRIIYAIRRSLLKMNKTYEINEDKNLNVECDLRIKKQIDNYFKSLLPNGVEIEWLFNGDSFETYQKKGGPFKLNHLKQIGSEFKIMLAQSDQSGVYICSAKIQDSNATQPEVYGRHILDIAVVLVVKKKALQKIPGQSLSIPCNANILHSIFGNGLFKLWYHNSKLIRNESFLEKKRDFAEFYYSDKLNLENLNFSDSGVYECRVHEPQTGRIWPTSRIKLNVGVAKLAEIMDSKLYWVLLTLFVVAYLIVIGLIMNYNYRLYLNNMYNFRFVN